VIASWDAMRERRVELITYGFQFFVADESHKGKSLDASQTKAARLLAMPVSEDVKADIPGAKTIPHVLFLSGTPLKNSVVELWPQLSALNPDIWGKLAKFKNQYDVLSARGFAKDIPGFDQMSESQREDALYRLEQRKLDALTDLRDRLDCSVIRRLKQDMNLPPKYRAVVSVTMPPDIRDEYIEAKSNFEAWLAETVRKKLLERGLDERTADQDAYDAVARAMRAEVLVQLGRLREISGRGKVASAIRMGRQLAAAGEPFIYFCDHAEVVNELKKALKAAGIKFGVIRGSTTPANRSRIVREFQNDRTIDAIICTTAAKEGITLTRAAVTIFVEHFWTAADEQQAEDRIHRISQTRPATIAYLHVPGTVDDYMASLISGKRSLTRAIMGAEVVSEEAADEAAKDEAVKDFISRLTISDDAIYKAQYAAAPAPLRAWMEAHEGEVRDAIREVIYPHGPPLESEEKVLREILTRLSPYRRNPRPRR
jgi:SNF2 family DNA or RNA helicase